MTECLKSKTTYQIQNYRPHQGQLQLHNSTAREVMIVASTRSGKTESLIHDIIVNAWNNKSKHAILVGAPTYKMVYDVLETPIVNKLRSYGLLFHHSKSGHKVHLKNNKVIYFVTLEKDAVDNNVRSKNISDIYVDECAYVDKYSIEVLRMRLLTTNGRLIMATTPKGMNNWVYQDYFVGERNPNVEYIKYALLDNPIITQEAVDRIKESTDPLMYRQEVLAEFINLYENQVYHQFSEDNVDSTEYSPFYPVYIGIDFNVKKNAWVALQVQPNNTYHILHEGYGATTTAQAAHQIIDRYGHQPIVVPDMTGRRLQGSGYTDIQLLRQAGLHNTIERTTNPDRLKRYSLMNAGFNNALGQRRITIDSSCVNLIQELRELSFKKDSDHPDTHSEKMGHRSDALGYIITYLSGGVVGRMKEKTASPTALMKEKIKANEIYTQQIIC